jgi:hypothetical protein
MTVARYFDLAQRLTRCAHLLDTRGKARSIYAHIEAQMLDLIHLVVTPDDVEQAILSALNAGSLHLLNRLPALDQGRAITPYQEDWFEMAPVLTTAVLRAAVEKGVKPDEGLVPLIEEAGKRDELRDFVLNDLSQSRFWYWRHSRVLGHWLPIKGTEISCDFIKAQVAHHPQKARKAFIEAAPLESPHTKVVAAVWLAAGVASDADVLKFGDPRCYFTGQASSSHDAMQIFADYSSLEALHAKYHPQWRRSLSA